MRTMKTPLSFKIFFGTVTTVIVGIWLLAGYFGYQVIQAGPEGVGRAIGQVLKGVEEGQK